MTERNIADKVLGVTVITVYGDDGTIEQDDCGDDVAAAQALAKQKANNYDPDTREIGGAHNTFHVVTFDEGGRFSFEEISPDEGKGYNAQ